MFEDRNENGSYDDGEGVGEATLELRAMDSGFQDTRQSDRGGYYIFAFVAPGSYRLVSVLPPSYELVDPTAWAFPLEAGQTLTFDFEVRRKPTYLVFLPVVLRPRQ